MISRSNYLLCYDISQPKRLRRVHCCVRRYGQRLQNSVYYIGATPAQLRKLCGELAALINAREDDVRIYPLYKHRPIYWLGQPVDADGIMDFSLPLIQRVGSEQMLGA